MKLYTNLKKGTRWGEKNKFEDDIQLSGRKGGKAMKRRKEEQQIDLEMRNYYTYR